MRRWPAYTIDRVAELTPYQQQALLDEDDVVSFGSMEEYAEWRQTKR